MHTILQQRKIDRLFHFTRAENLHSIFQHGLMPRSDIEAREISSTFNDYLRLDKCPNAVCVSIEFPNYKMFYRLRMMDQQVQWAVLRLDASVLYNFPCAFCWTNAGDASVYNVPLEQRMGIRAFCELFQDRERYPKRQDLNIPDWYPTNPQAEVLVFGTIPINYIYGVYFNDKDAWQKFREYIPGNVESKVDYSVFKPRGDCRSW